MSGLAGVPGEMVGYWYGMNPALVLSLAGETCGQERICDFLLVMALTPQPGPMAGYYGGRSHRDDFRVGPGVAPRRARLTAQSMAPQIVRAIFGAFLDEFGCYLAHSQTCEVFSLFFSVLLGVVGWLGWWF